MVRPGNACFIWDLLQLAMTEGSERVRHTESRRESFRGREKGGGKGSEELVGPGHRGSLEASVGGAGE